MFDEILLPVDGSENSRVAIAHAGGIAEAFGSTVHVLHVVDERRLHDADAADELVAAGERLVESVADDLEGDGIDTSSRVETGIPRDVIVDYARGIDLVVLGSHGRTGARKFLLGSVAEGVVRRSDVPVLTVPPSRERAEFSPYRTVLVPTDGSPGAAAALDPAAALSTAFDARLDALSVVEEDALGLDVRSTVFHDRMEERARTTVDDLEEGARAAGVPSVGTAVGHGSAAAEIVRYAEEHDTDLVAMGTHGREGVERYLLGSVTERVLPTSSVPVLTVRVPDSGDEPGTTSEPS